MKDYNDSGYTLAELSEWLTDYEQMEQEAKELEALGGLTGNILAEQTRYRMYLIEKRIKSLPFGVERVYLETVLLNGVHNAKEIAEVVFPVLHLQALKLFRRYEEDRAATTRATRKQGAPKPSGETRGKK